MKSHKKSIHHFEMAFSLDSVYTLDYKSPYSTQLAAEGNFDKALKSLNDFLTKIDQKKQTM